MKRRAHAAGITIEPDLLEALEAYYLLLTKWNARINLTAFRLTPGGEDDAVDWLLVEPLVAARYVPGRARTLLDAGSGGGSPAIPMALASPQLHLRMVEVKTRKAIFLREAVRTLGLKRAEVETARFEELLPRPELHEAQDLVTIRAVRVETRRSSPCRRFSAQAACSFSSGDPAPSRRSTTPPHRSSGLPPTRWWNRCEAGSWFLRRRGFNPGARA